MIAECAQLPHLTTTNIRARVGFPPLRQLRFTTGTWREGLIVGALTLACLANALARLPR